MDTLLQVRPDRRAALIDQLRRGLGTAAIAVPLLFVMAAVAMEGWAARRFLLFYIAPFFVAFFVWARIRVDSLARTSRGALAVDAVTVVLGAVRFAGPFLPFSGHMLFFVYSALTTRSVRYGLLMLVLVAETTWFKLVLWHDLASWSLGIGAGLALAALRIAIDRSTRPSSSP